MWESERSLENWGEAQTVKKGFPLRNKLTPQDPRKKSDVVVHAQSHHGNTRDKQIPGRQVPGQGTAPKVFLWLLHVSTCTCTYLNTRTHTHTRQQGKGITHCCLFVIHTLSPAPGTVPHTNRRSSSQVSRLENSVLDQRFRASGGE